MIELDYGRHIVTVNGKAVHFTPVEWKYLSLLISANGNMVRRNRFGPRTDMSNKIDVHMKNIRRKLKVAKSVEVITTLKGVGYRLDHKS